MGGAREKAPGGKQITKGSLAGAGGTEKKESINGKGIDVVHGRGQGRSDMP